MANLEPFLLRTWNNVYYRLGIPVFWRFSPLPQNCPDHLPRLAPNTNDAWQFHRIDSRLIFFCDGFMLRGWRWVTLKFVRGFIKVTEDNLLIVVFANFTALLTMLLLTLGLLLSSDFGLLQLLIAGAIALVIGRIVVRVLFIRSFLTKVPHSREGAP